MINNKPIFLLVTIFFFILLFPFYAMSCIVPSSQTATFLKDLPDAALAKAVVARVLILSTEYDQNKYEKLTKVKVLGAIKGIKENDTFTVSSRSTSCSFDYVVETGEMYFIAGEFDDAGIFKGEWNDVMMKRMDGMPKPLTEDCRGEGSESKTFMRDLPDAALAKDVVAKVRILSTQIDDQYSRIDALPKEEPDVNLSSSIRNIKRSIQAETLSLITPMSRRLSRVVVLDAIKGTDKNAELTVASEVHACASDSYVNIGETYFISGSFDNAGTFQGIWKGYCSPLNRKYQLKPLSASMVKIDRITQDRCLKNYELQVD